MRSYDSKQIFGEAYVRTGNMYTRTCNAVWGMDVESNSRKAIGCSHWWIGELHHPINHSGRGKWSVVNFL